MATQFDEKGKIFTHVISKRPVSVTIQTLQQMIRGKMHIRPNDRIKDELNQPEIFIAITEATVYNSDGKELYSCDFLTVNSQHIIWIIPDDEIRSAQAPTKAEDE